MWRTESHYKKQNVFFNQVINRNLITLGEIYSS